MKRIADSLKVRGRAVRLAKWDPRATPGCKDKDEAAERLAKNLARIDTLQYRLMAKVASRFSSCCRAWTLRARTA